MTALGPLTEEERAENVAKLAASPYGPGLHKVIGVDRDGRWESACGCSHGRQHLAGARGATATATR